MMGCNQAPCCCQQSQIKITICCPLWWVFLFCHIYGMPDSLLQLPSTRAWAAYFGVVIALGRSLGFDGDCRGHLLAFTVLDYWILVLHWLEILWAANQDIFMPQMPTNLAIWKGTTVLDYEIKIQIPTMFHKITPFTFDFYSSTSSPNFPSIL